jgi:Ankyrin repeats (3 copies)
VVQTAKQFDTLMTELLLQHGFDPNERSQSRSVLQSPVECGHLDMVKLLLQYGANAHDFEVEEIYDLIKLAVKYALFSGSHLDIIRLLLLRGAVV